MPETPVKKKLYDSFSPRATMPFERYVFEREAVGFMSRISRGDMERIGKWDIERFEDSLGYDIVYRITNMMAHGDKKETNYVDVPLTWRDHLKLDINLWARKHLLRPHFFFTNIAKAISILKITPRFRTIPTETTIKNYCPHFTTSPQRDHIEFMIARPLEWEDFSN